MHDHNHDASHKVSRKLVIASIATLAFVVIELGVGVFANSLALMSDALHNFTDTLALVLAWIGVRLERKPATASKSYGYQRAGVLTAFINAGALAAFTIFIFAEAIQRLQVKHPAINVRALLFTAVAAFVLNAAITWSLRREGKHDVNIHSAVIHMLGDAVSSVGIMVAAGLIAVTGSQLWDPIISMLIGLLILWSSWGVLRETVNLLLEGTPSGIDPNKVTTSLAAMDGVYGVHHLHIWALAPSRPALSCHLMVGDVAVKTTAKLLDDINEMLARKYRIAHTTVQFEFANCDVDDPYCIPYTAKSDVSAP